MNDLRPSHKRRTIFLVILLALVILVSIFLVPRLAAARQGAQVMPAAVRIPEPDRHNATHATPFAGEELPLMGASGFVLDGSGWEAEASSSKGCACDEVSDTSLGSLLLGVLILGMRFFV
jgi:hypothetical protein